MPKALFTAWRILLGRLPTYDSIIQRGMVVNSSLCALCKAAEESSQHLFLTCVYAQRVWSLCLRWIGFLFVQHKDLINHFERFHLAHFTAKQNQVWKDIWVVGSGNLAVFKQGIANAEEIFHSAQLSAWLRLKHGASPFSFAFSDLDSQSRPMLARLLMWRMVKCIFSSCCVEGTCGRWELDAGWLL